jgi:hypothetical protein
MSRPRSQTPWEKHSWHVIGDCRLRVQNESRVVYLRRRSMVSLIQATEKSLSLQRFLPEQVTANLAPGTFPSFVIIESMRETNGAVRAHCILIAFLAQTSIVVAPLARLLRCKMISFRYVCERFRV